MPEIEMLGALDIKAVVEKIRKTVQSISKQEVKIAPLDIKKRAIQIVMPYTYSSNLINSIAHASDDSFKADVIFHSPYALALDTGKPSLAPDIAKLKKINTKFGTRYVWEGEDAESWKLVKMGKSGKRVLVGVSGGRQTPQGKPYPQGLHFLDEIDAVMEVITDRFFDRIGRMKF